MTRTSNFNAFFDLTSRAKSLVLSPPDGRDCILCCAPKVRVLLADDHIEILRAFNRLLAPSCEVMGSVTDSLRLIEEVNRLKPDVIVLDLNMPGLHGLDACTQIKNTSPLSKVVIVSAANDEEMRQRALNAGASAFVLKQRAAQELYPAIQKAVQQDNGQSTSSRPG